MSAEPAKEGRVEATIRTLSQAYAGMDSWDTLKIPKHDVDQLLGAIAGLRESMRLDATTIAAKDAKIAQLDGVVRNLEDLFRARGDKIAGLQVALADLAVDATDAARYRWLRSEEVATDPYYYPFWGEFNAKLCREEKLDELIDNARTRNQPCPSPTTSEANRG